MKALIVGYGSIGARHARLLQELGLDFAIVSRRAHDAIRVYADIPTAIRDFAPDYAVIASRTSEHAGDIAAFADAGFTGTLLVEKPMLARAGDLPANAFANIYVAYNLRFHPALLRFKAIVDTLTPYAVHAYVGQYLPDWRPGTDYRQSYSADKSIGGGVLRDLSHELDYLNWIFGGWTRMTALGGHLSNLEINSDDVFSLLFETQRCPVVSVQMNYLDSKLRREAVALTDQGSVSVDFVSGTVTFKDNSEIFAVDRDHTFLAEHRAAMGDGAGLCSLQQGDEVVRMIDAAEAAASQHKWIAV